MCFKVDQAADSKTVLGSAVATSISSSATGRAFARFQGGGPIEFQSARIGNQSRHLVTDTDRLTAHFITPDNMASPPVLAEPREVPNEEQDLHRVVGLIRSAAAKVDHRPSVPWPSDLPPLLSLAAAGDAFPQHRSLLVGVADDPQRQRRVPAHHCFDDAIVAFTGSASSGHHDALVTAAISAAASLSPDDLHLYGVDLVGHKLTAIAALPHVGAIASRDDATALRILNWLLGEVARRRSAMERVGVADYPAYVQAGPTDLPRIVVLVAGVDRMFLHGEGTSSPLLGPMTTVVNEIAGTGIQVLFSGTHAMTVNRLGTTASRRFTFAANDASELPPSVPKAMRCQLTRPGRCVDSRSGLVTQVARVDIVDTVDTVDTVDFVDLDHSSPEAGRDAGRTVQVRDLVQELAYLTAQTYPQQKRHPRRFTKAPWPLHVNDLVAPLIGSPPIDFETPLPLGVRPDTGEMLWIDPREDGRALRIIGGPKSGRSNALIALGLLAEQHGWHVRAAVASRRSPLFTQPRWASWLVPIEEIVDQVAVGVTRPTLVLIDDAHRLDDEFPWRCLEQIDNGFVVTVVAGTAVGLGKPQLIRSLGAAGGVVLMPVRPRDTSVIGLGNVDEDWVMNPLPGIGVAAIVGEAHRVQFPLVDGADTLAAPSGNYGASGTLLAATMADHTLASS